MRSTQEHRDFVVAGVEKGMSARSMQEELERKGLTNTQANCVVRNQRKRLKVYKVGSADKTEF